MVTGLRTSGSIVAGLDQYYATLYRCVPSPIYDSLCFSERSNTAVMRRLSGICSACGPSPASIDDALPVNFVGCVVGGTCCIDR